MYTFPQRQIGSTDLKMDTLGFGCAPLGNLYHVVSDEDADAVLQSAWDNGFKYYDTAPHYGQGLSEQRTGNLLRPLQGKHCVTWTVNGHG